MHDIGQVRYWALSDQGHGHGGSLKLFSFTAIQTVRSYNSSLVQARKLKLSMYVRLIIISNTYEYRHA